MNKGSSWSLACVRLRILPKYMPQVFKIRRDELKVSGLSLNTLGLRECPLF